jgi:hypothetical protein
MMREKALAFFISLIGAGMVLSAGPAGTVRPDTYTLQFSTYFGSYEDCHDPNKICYKDDYGAYAGCRGMAVDAQGNVYLAGSTWRDGWPTTQGAYDRTWHGDSDMAISKWSPDGKLIWSTLIGSAGHDRPYTVKVDKAGFVYVAGLGSVGMPTGSTSYQPKPLYHLDNTPKPHEHYTGSNGYVAKLTPDGSKVVWGSYVGNALGIRDLALDDEGNIYMTLEWDSNAAVRTIPESWFAHAYCKTPHGQQDVGIIKVSSDGSKVLWASFIGGSNGNRGNASIAVGPDHCPVLFMGTHSKDMPTTPGAFSSAPDSAWLGKLSADGSKLLFGTYIGDKEDAGSITHDVALDPHGNVYVACTVVGNWPVTPGAFQTKFGGGKSDWGIAKFSPTGKLLAATYLGGSGDEVNGPDTISVDQQGNALITGAYLLTSLDYPVTPGCFQPKHGGGPSDGVVSLLSSDLSTLIYSTYMGGSGYDALRANAFAADGSFYVAGHSVSPDWPTKNAYQNDFKGQAPNGIVFAKFKRVQSAAGNAGGR